MTGKLAKALDFMVFEAARRADAAARAGMKDHSLRAAMRKPHVLHHFRELQMVLRESERPRNISRAAEIRDGSPNHAAAVQALRWLHGQDDHAAGPAGARYVAPGIVINLVQREAATVDPTVISINPAVDNDAGRTTAPIARLGVQ